MGEALNEFSETYRKTTVVGTSVTVVEYFPEVRGVPDIDFEP